MTFQASDFKGKQFLNLLDDELYPIEPSYTKGGLWLKHFGHSISLCVRATRAITNHAPTGEYRLRFFLKEDFSCLYGFYLIESRCHILHECRRFNNYWNLMRDTISQFVSFLECFLLWRRHHIAEQSPCSFSSFWSYFLFSFLFSFYHISLLALSYVM